MAINWKKRKNLQPSVILSRIEAIRTISPEGKASFSGFELHNVLPALQSMLDFPASASDVQKSTIIWRGVAKVVGPLTPDSVLKSINGEMAEHEATRESEYHVLTALSIDLSGIITTSKIEKTKIQLFKGPFPRRYESRDVAIANSRIPVPALPTSYCRVAVSVKAKSTFGAITKALRALDIQRGIWCLLGNSRMQLWGQEWIPINVARLGTVHTIHLPSGKLATEEVWFEPNFIEASPFRPSEPAIFRKNCMYALRRLFASPYADKLVEALLRYVRALDERDQNTAFLKIWGALESLASPGDANYDQIVRRCAFVHKEADYHRQILEHLREYRNQSVHAGDQTELAKTHCFQAQFYFFYLFFFHLRNLNKFASLEEANSFLDLPMDTTLLRKRERLIRGAIRFFSR